MASLPPQASSQRGRSSPQGRSSSATSPTHGASPDQSRAGGTQSDSTASEGSHRVLLNGVRNLASESARLDDEKQQSQQLDSLQDEPPPKSDAAEPQKCWICLNTETDDTPMSSEWRSPCPCALTAHEGCLLDWIADLQAQSKHKRSKAPVQVLCPQCKSEITVARPRSLVIDAANLLGRLTDMVVLPGMLGALGGCAITGSFVYGVNAVYMVFGEEDATRILGSGTRPPHHAGSMDTPSDFWILFRNLTPFAAYHGWSWRLGVGLPLIPAALVLSRTSLADYMLPVLPIAFFASQDPEWEHLDLLTWEPNAATTLVVLPYLRLAYKGLYERFFAERERRWSREIEPPSPDTEEGAQGAEHPGGDDEVQGGNEDDILMQLNLELDIVQGEEEEDEEGDEMEAAQANPFPQPAPPPQFPAQPIPGDADAAGDQAAQAIPIAPDADVHQHPAPRAGNITITTGNLGDTMLGALLFPAISAAMGGLLKLSLPPSWTTPAAAALGKGGRRVGAKPGAGITSILQARWGRSIVGGCLFVVLKDALVLYYRWKMAQSHRNRRVVDYNRRKGPRGVGRA